MTCLNQIRNMPGAGPQKQISCIRVWVYIFLALWRCGFVRGFERAEFACECLQCIVCSYRSCVLDNRFDPPKRDAVRENQNHVQMGTEGGAGRTEEMLSPGAICALALRGRPSRRLFSFNAAPATKEEQKERASESATGTCEGASEGGSGKCVRFATTAQAEFGCHSVEPTITHLAGRHACAEI